MHKGDIKQAVENQRRLSSEDVRDSTGSPLHVRLEFRSCFCFMEVLMSLSPSFCATCEDLPPEEPDPRGESLTARSHLFPFVRFYLTLTTAAIVIQRGIDNFLSSVVQRGVADPLAAVIIHRRILDPLASLVGSCGILSPVIPSIGLPGKTGRLPSAVWPGAGVAALQQSPTQQCLQQQSPNPPPPHACIRHSSSLVCVK